MMLTNDKRVAFFCLMVASGLFAYVAYRAHHLSFTHDESLTFSILFGNEIYRNSANNHLLNTYLMDFCLRICGDTEGVLRLPNVFGFLIYSFFSYKISKRLTGSFLQIACFLLLLLNPFILDFFSLARGYGLSLAMMVASIYFLLKILDNHKSLIDNYLFTLFSIYAVIANFTLLIFYLAAMSVWGLIWLYHEKWKIFIRLTPLSILLAHGIILFNLMKFLFYLKSINGLYAGGVSGFVESVVDSNIVSLLYNENMGATFLKNVLVYAVILSFLIIFAFNFIAIFKKPFLKSSLVLMVVLVLCIIIPIVQNRVLGILYPTERTASFYYILWVLPCVFYLFEKPVLKKIHTISIYAFTGFIVLNFINTANLKYCNSWKYDADTKDMMLTVNQLHIEKKLPNSVQLSIFWLNEPAAKRYYRPQLYYEWITINRFESDKIQADDVYFLPEEEASKEPFKSQFFVLKFYENSKMVLLKRD